MEHNSKNDDAVIEKDTCFAASARYGVPCGRKACRNWINSKKNMNCVHIAAQRGPMTLQEIGDIFGLTRMRICQIEKNICKKTLLPLIDEKI